MDFFQTLRERIFSVRHLQCAWLILFFSGPCRLISPESSSSGTFPQCAGVCQCCWGSMFLWTRGKSSVCLCPFAGWGLRDDPEASSQCCGLHETCVAEPQPRVLRGRNSRRSSDCLTASVFSCVHRVRWPVLPSRVVHSFDTTLDQSQFFLLVLCRLWFIFSFSSKVCRCGRPIDLSDRRRAACAVAMVLGSRGFAVGSAVARVCHEAGVRFSTNIRIQDMDIVASTQVDERWVQVLTNGLLLFPR